MPSDLVRVSRALLSVSDKTGLVDFTRAMAAMDIELISTGGTRKFLIEAGHTPRAGTGMTSTTS